MMTKEQASKAIRNALDYAKREKMVEYACSAEIALALGDNWAGFILDESLSRSMEPLEMGITGHCLSFKLRHL